MKYLAHYILLLFIGVSCQQPSGNDNSHLREPNATPNIPESFYQYKGVTIYNKGPRGGNYSDSSGQMYGYRIFRIKIINDTLVPFSITINFPADPVKLRPDSNRYLKVFLFPDELTPDTIQETYNFGVTGSERYLDTGLTKPSLFKKTLQPKERCVLYIGIISPENGVTRSNLFITGLEPEELYVPSQPAQTNANNKPDLIFAIGIDPYNYWARISCGEISF